MDSNSNYGNNGKKKTGLTIGIIVGVLFFVLFDIVLFAKIINRNNSSSSKSVEKRTETEKKRNSSKAIDKQKEKDLNMLPTNQNIDIGGYIFFGSYEQDGNLSNGKEPLEWEVLDVLDDKALLISKYIIDQVCYDEGTDVITWENCSLRNWLNEDFVTSAFSEQESSFIQDVYLVNDSNQYSGNDGGNDTIDKVFCLSISDIMKYYNFKYWHDSYGYCQNLVTEPTPYAEKKVDTQTISTDAYYNSLQIEGYTKDVIGKKGARWWLRSPGDWFPNPTGLYSIYACDVYMTGCVGPSHSDICNFSLVGVRPALWISLDNGGMEKEFSADTEIFNPYDSGEWRPSKEEFEKAFFSGKYTVKNYYDETTIVSARELIDECMESYSINMYTIDECENKVLYLMGTEKIGVLTRNATDEELQHIFVANIVGNVYAGYKSQGDGVNFNCNALNVLISINEDGTVNDAEVLESSYYMHIIACSYNGSSVSKGENQTIYSNVSIGDFVTMGEYEQDNNLTNGKEPIVWEVLDIKDGKALLISRYVLDETKYNQEKEWVNWETCSLRGWLNKDFYYGSFSPEDRSKICVTNNSPDEYEWEPSWDVTEDYIFCLSLGELRQYYNPRCQYSGYYSEELIISPTMYAERNVETDMFSDNSIESLEIFGYSKNAIGVVGAAWWLRTPGYDGYETACVVTTLGVSGELEYYNDVDDDGIGVRPAMWISLD